MFKCSLKSSVARAVTLGALIMLFVLCLAPGALAFDNTGWYWPVPDSLIMSRGYGSGHLGLDIKTNRDVNETVVAARDGTVIAVYQGCTKWNGYGEDHSGCSPIAHLTTGDMPGIRYYQEDGGTKVCNYGIGNGVVIDHGDGVWTEYSHMASVTVTAGQRVSGGEPIGTMGSYGNSTGRHLHFAIKTNSYFKSGACYPNGNAVNTNAYGDEYIIYGTWNGTDNIHYSRDYSSALKYYIDVNATLDGASRGDLSGLGSCDVYINGALVAGNAIDYYTQWPEGTTYVVKNIVPASGYTYAGQSEYSGTLGSSAVAINLPFLSYATLELKGTLDGAERDDLIDLASCDVYIDNELVAEGVSAYTGAYPQGASYRIRNIVTEVGGFLRGRGGDLRHARRGRDGRPPALRHMAGTRRGVAGGERASGEHHAGELPDSVPAHLFRHFRDRARRGMAEGRGGDGLHPGRVGDGELLQCQ